MPISINSQEEIYQDVRDSLTGKTPALTDFSEDSPEYVLLHDGWAGLHVEYEHANLAATLSGWIQWAGKTINEDDLRELESQFPDFDSDDVLLDTLNKYQKDRHLDAKAAENGVTRDPGSPATGEVLFTVTQTGTTIDAGTEVATQPDEDAQYLSFETTEIVDSGDGLTVSAPIEAEFVGTDWNVGANTITHTPSNVPGVTSVTNPNSTSGGENEESTPELRERATNASTQTSGGGTTAGIEGGVIELVDGVDQGDTLVQQFHDPDAPENELGYPYGDVIVDGGDDAAVQDAIDALHPSGVRHRLVRPTVRTVDIMLTCVGEGIDTAVIEDVVRQHASSRGLGEWLYSGRLTQLVMNTDDDIADIDDIVIGVTDEPLVFDSTQDVYELNHGEPIVPDGISEVTGTLSGMSGHVFVEGTDYEETTTGTDPNAIDWSLAGDNPDDGTTFYVDYDADGDMPAVADERIDPGTVTVTTEMPQ